MANCARLELPVYQRLVDGVWVDALALTSSLVGCNSSFELLPDSSITDFLDPVFRSRNYLLELIDMDLNGIEGEYRLRYRIYNEGWFEENIPDRIKNSAKEIHSNSFFISVGT